MPSLKIEKQHVLKVKFEFVYLTEIFLQVDLNIDQTHSLRKNLNIYIQ